MIFQKDTWSVLILDRNAQEVLHLILFMIFLWSARPYESSTKYSFSSTHGSILTFTLIISQLTNLDPYCVGKPPRIIIALALPQLDVKASKTLKAKFPNDVTASTEASLNTHRNYEVRNFTSITTSFPRSGAHRIKPTLSFTRTTTHSV